MATPISQWKKVDSEEVSLPSGNVCLVRRPGMEKLFSSGVLPDELTKIALQQIENAGGRSPQDHKKKGASEEIDPEIMKKFMESENAIQDIFMAFDRVTEMCVVEPRVKWHMKKSLDPHGTHIVDEKGVPMYEEIHPSDRSEDVLYTDEIDIEDKTFLFNFVVGGTRDLERFHQEYGDAMADLSVGQNVELSAERTDGNQV